MTNMKNAKTKALGKKLEVARGTIHERHYRPSKTQVSTPAGREEAAKKGRKMYLHHVKEIRPTHYVGSKQHMRDKREGKSS